VATVNIVYRCIANQIAELFQLFRIADRSIMPPVTTGNTPCAIIGERARRNNQSRS
jgi:hypothetical protein